MDLLARDAGNGLIRVQFVSWHFLGGPALHVQASIWTAKEERRHYNTTTRFPVVCIEIYQRRSHAEADIGASPKTVGELRRLAAWPENLAITTPQERDPESVVKVSKANVATRTAPKS